MVYVLFENWADLIDLDYATESRIIGVYSTMKKAQEAKERMEKEAEEIKKEYEPSWSSWDEDDGCWYTIEEHELL